VKSVTTDKLTCRGNIKAESIIIDNLIASDATSASRVAVIDSKGSIGTSNTIAITSLLSESLKSRAIETSSLKLNGLSLPSETSHALLSIDKNGDLGIATVFNTPNLKTSSLDSIDAKIESLLVDTLTAAKTIEVGILNAKTLTVKELRVDGSVQLLDDVFIKGSVSVEGSVIGSGPYVDSSYMRLKSNVEPITNALDKVCSLAGVLAATKYY
jgi:hypothetical protein